MADDSLSGSGKKRSSRRLLDVLASESTSATSPSLDSRGLKPKDKEKSAEKLKKDSSKSIPASLPRPEVHSSSSDRPTRPVRDSVGARTTPSDISLQVPKQRDNAADRSEGEVRLEDLPSLEGVLNKWSGMVKGSLRSAVFPVRSVPWHFFHEFLLRHFTLVSF